MNKLVLVPFIIIALMFPSQSFSQDNDLDGWTVAAGDCNDGDNTIHPGAEEIPGNSIDENCDGSDACTCYTDADIDSYGDPYSPFLSGDCDCSDAGEAWTGTDCNDTDNTIHPGATELCGDGIDSNCDLIGGGGGAADEDMDGLNLTNETLLGTSDCDMDTDNDGISDGIEDLDRDGVKDVLETNPTLFDTDADGLSDGIEENFGITDPLDADSDGDGLADGAEDADHDGVKDLTESSPMDADTDDDGIRDSDESVMSLNKLISDSDGDALNDGQEIGRNTPVAGGTSEVRGLAYLGTNMGAWQIDANPATKTDPLAADSDNDGISDGNEDKDHDGLVDASETNPLDTDFDNDGLSDGNEDLDDDGVLDSGETNPMDSDSDDDGLNDGLEKGMNSPIPGGTSAGFYAPNRVSYLGTAAGWTGDSHPASTTNPRSTDTDSDGLTDDEEDVNHNGMVDAGETDPNDPDSDDDTSLDGADCQPLNPTIYPGATEIVADGIDQDCNGGDICYKDADNDGYRPDLTSTVVSVDCDCADQYEAIAADPIGDCNDAQAGIYPGAPEIPEDGIDQDCNGMDARICFVDADQDGYGNMSGTTVVALDGTCDIIESESGNSLDCDDTNAGIHPGATEIVADGIDQDCNGGDICYRDADDDGYRPDGTSTVVSTDCDCADAAEASSSDPTGDCDDTQASIHPGASEIIGDGIDQDCSGGELCYLDNDTDGYGSTATISSADLDCFDTYESMFATDCNDGNSSIHPGATEVVADGIDQDCDGGDICYKDADNDGYRPDGTSTVASADCDCADQYEASSVDPIDDCNDARSDVYPDAPEIPEDGIDQDCNGADAVYCYVDADADGYGTNLGTMVIALDGSCNAVDGESYNMMDCDDYASGTHPGASEIPGDGIDQDCNGLELCFADYDGDTHGSSATFEVATMDCILAGAANISDDCDDYNDLMFPGNNEVCDGYDNDCDGFVDNNAIDVQTWYLDNDWDGFGNSVVSVLACDPPGGYVANDLDCDDNNNGVHPGATEFCDGLDNDCNGFTDDNAVDAPIWYADSDEDGFGNPGVSVFSCDPGPGYTLNNWNWDCDDTDNSVYPGATEYCDGKDNDCNGLDDDYAADAQYWYYDGDSDGYGDPYSSVYDCNQPSGYVNNDLDCDDGNTDIHPGAAEICDGWDNDCNGNTDDNALDATWWYYDNDYDSYGSTIDSVYSCEKPYDYVDNKLDCDDNNQEVYPDAPEICDGLDNDCDNEIDENSEWAPYWYADADNDGFGNFYESIQACDMPAGYTDNADDCDDTNEDINPFADELCNGKDDNCDGGIDEGFESYVYNENHSICQGQTYLWHGITYSGAGNYTYIHETNYGCEVYNLQLTVNPTYFTADAAEICTGAGYLWHDSVYTTSGTHVYNPLSEAGCDSIFELTLTLNPGSGYAFHDTVTVCDDENFSWHGNNYFSSGIYEDHYQTQAGCDSTYFLHLTVNPSFHFNLTTNAVIGDTVNWHGQTITASGTYYDTHQAQNGCDSVYALTIYFKEQVMSELWGVSMDGGNNNIGFIYKTDGNGDNFTVVHNFNEEGYYADGGLTAGPDGLLYGMTLLGGVFEGGIIYSIDPVTENFVSHHSFDTYDYGFPTGSLLLASNNKLYGMTAGIEDYDPGSLFEYDPATGVFETKVYLNQPTGYFPAGVTLAEGSDHLLYGVTQGGGESGNGVLFSYDFNTETYNPVYHFDTGNNNGNVTLAADGNLYGIQFEANNIYKYAGPGNIDVIHSFSPDSLGRHPIGRLEADSAGMLWGITMEGGEGGAGTIYSYDTEYGNYTKLADLASVGAEYPIGSLTRTSNGKLYGVTVGVIGGEEGYLFEYDPLTDSLVIKHNFGISENGYGSSPKLIEVCQSPQFGHNLSALDLCNPGDTMLYVNVTGNGITYSWQADFGSGFENLSNDAVYSGVNNDTLFISGANASMNGYMYRCVVSSTCPSINVNSNTSELNIRGEYDFTESASICTGSAYLWQNNTYNTAGTYYAHYNSIYGCDSTYQLTLTTTPGTGYAYHDTASICDGDSYTWRGMQYSESGIYQDSYTTLAGCDSSYFLHLNVNPVYDFTETVVICDGGAYLWQGTIYDYEGTYHRYFNSSLGCDSVYHLNLYIDYENPGYSSLEEATICNGSSYLWMGNIYTEPGIYEEYRTILEGGMSCDSAFFLNLHVSGGPGFTQIDTIEICGGDTAFYQGNSYTVSGLYMVPYLTVGGCDSTYYLNLTVHPSYHFAETFNSVIGDTVEWRGNQYFSDANVVENYTTALGCDSIYSLNIHFYPRYEGPDNTELWGMTSSGGDNNLGCIFKTDGNGENQTVVYSFEPGKGTHPYGSLLYASNGKLYGMTSSGGANNTGTLFEYDMVNNQYLDNISFNGTNGAIPVGALVENENGLLYGMTRNGGLNNYGVLFSFDPETHHLQKLLDLANVGLAYPNGDLTIDDNGHLWGLTQAGGDNGIDFGEFSPLPEGLGAAFEYDPLSGTMVNVIPMQGLESGISPSGTLVQSSADGQMYGVTYTGPGDIEFLFENTLHLGTVFSVSQGMNQVNTIHTFEFDTELNGAYPIGGLVQAQNDKLYGLTSEGGTNYAGVLYEVNTTNNTVVKKKDLDVILNGSTPMGPMMMICNGTLFGMTSEGGEYGYGTIYRYDAAANTLIKTHDFDVTTGAYPKYSTLTEVPAVLRIVNQPTDAFVCRQSDESISVNASGNFITYQWQISHGSGFTNISNNGVFAGATSSGLQINDAPDSLNGVYFRCVVTSQCPVTSVVSDTITLQVNPIYQFAETHAICRGESYTWHNSDYNDNGTYAANYLTANGCDSIYMLNLTVHELPFVYAGDDMNICEGSTISLTGSGTANQYNWNNNVVNSMSFQPLASNTYIVTGTDLLTGCKDYDTISVQLQPTPVVDAGVALTVCEGDSVTLTASGTATTYVWNNGVTNNVPFVVTNSDVFTVTGYDAYGCSDQDFTLVSVTPVPAVTLVLNDTVFCLTDNPMYLSGIPSAGTFYGTGVSGNTFYPDVAGPGDHDIIYSYTNGGGCSGFDTTTVSVIDCTGMDENDLFNVSIFPNPTSGQLSITFPAEDDYTLSFIDALGQIVQTEKIASQKTVHLDLNSVAPGVYMLKVENAEGFVLKRVVVER